MSNELEIRTLTERFFEGETSLAEEQRLYALYRSAEHLPDDLTPLREMMLDWGSLQNENEARNYTLRSTLHAPRLTVHAPRLTILSLAASLLLLIGFTTLWYQHSRQDECVAYVYGERVTDRAVVMQEMQTALASFDDDVATATMEQQMRELFAE